MGGCLGIFFRILAEAVAVRVAYRVVSWLTGDRLRQLVAAILAIFGIRISQV
jgi:hypothetical protein